MTQCTPFQQVALRVHLRHCHPPRGTEDRRKQFWLWNEIKAMKELGRTQEGHPRWEQPGQRHEESRQEEGNGEMKGQGEGQG